MLQFPAIVLLGVVAAVVYGVLHDQVTARVCVEYFTIGHPPWFNTESPTLLALGWGFVATWWVGLPLGILLAVAAREGKRSKRDVKTLIRPVGVLLGVTGCCALAAGIVGWLLARSGTIALFGRIADAVPREKHAAFLADLWAHNASYLVGAVGGVVLAAWVWSSRGPGEPGEAERRPS